MRKKHGESEASGGSGRVASGALPPPRPAADPAPLLDGWGSSRIDGGASAPYNMALAQVACKVNFGVVEVPVTVKCDKLRLGGWLHCPPDKAETIGQKLWGGFTWSRHAEGRRRGPRRVMELSGGLFGPRGEDGSAWLRVQWVEGAPSAYLTVEYNPQKVTESNQVGLGMSLAWLGLPPGGLYVERYDPALDIPLPRGYLLLDDRRRNPDLFEVGPEGPQTERTGFRKGSRLKFQLYDKGAERASAGVEIEVPYLTRFEVQVIRPGPLDDGGGLFEAPDGREGPAPAPGGSRLAGAPAWPRGFDCLTLGELPHVGYPGGTVTVRALAFDPCTISDLRMSSLAHSARFGGFKAAVHWAVRYLSREKLAVWLGACLPEVSPSPAVAFRRGWRRAVEAVTVPLVEGVRRASVSGLIPEPVAVPVMASGG